MYYHDSRNPSAHLPVHALTCAHTTDTYTYTYAPLQPFKSPPSQTPDFHYNSPRITKAKGENPVTASARQTDLRRATHQGKDSTGGGGPLVSEAERPLHISTRAILEE